MIYAESHSFFFCVRLCVRRLKVQVKYTEPFVNIHGLLAVYEDGLKNTTGLAAISSLSH